MNSRSSFKFIDAHCHLTDPLLFGKIEEVIQKSVEGGVETWIQGGTDPTEWKLQVELRKRFGESVVLAFGLHPWWISKQNPEKIGDALKALDKKLPQASFLGELGLDFGEKYQHSKALQMKAFESQLELNEKHQKPLVLHVVKAHSEAVYELKKRPQNKGLVHAFSEGKEVLRAYLDLGFYISVGGALLKPGYKKLKETLSFIPSDRLLIETDTLGPFELRSIANEMARLTSSNSGEELLIRSKENIIALGMRK